MSLDELEDIKKILKSLIIPHQMGLDPATLNKEYEDIEGVSINYQKFGHNNLVDFIMALDDTLIYDYNNNVIFPVLDEATAHIRKFVINQRRSRKIVKSNSGNSPSRFFRRSKSPSPSLESRNYLSSNFLINRKRSHSPSPCRGLSVNAKTKFQTYRSKFSPSPKRIKRLHKESNHIYRSETFNSNEIESFEEETVEKCRKRKVKDKSPELLKKSQMIEKSIQTDSNLMNGSIRIGSEISKSSKSCQTDSSLDNNDLEMPKNQELDITSDSSFDKKVNPILNLRDPRIRKSLINKRDLTFLGIVINQSTILEFTEKALDMNQKFFENHQKLKNAIKFGIISLPMLVPSEPVDSPFEYLFYYLESENSSFFLSSCDPRLRRRKNENSVNRESLIQPNIECDHTIPDYISDQAYYYHSYYDASPYDYCHCSEQKFTCQEFPGYYFDPNEGIHKAIPIQYHCCGQDYSTSVCLSNSSEKNKTVKKLSIDDYKTKFGIKELNGNLDNSEQE